MPPRSSRRYAAALWVLLALFTFRVAAQPAALVLPSVLPPFEIWHSATVPYGLLLASQLLILIACGWTAWIFAFDRLSARRGLGVWLQILGGVYFIGMLLRLVLGFTLLRHVPWFASPIPTVFHLVLATFILLVGHFHRYGDEAALETRR